MRAIRELRTDGAAWSVLAIALAALAMRLVDLDARPMHHDESLHAVFSWYLSEGRGYVHDPLMHGPLQFHLIAGAFRLLGESELVSRLPAALFGSALVACPLLLRRRLGTTGVVVAAAMIALSPSLLYYSRFARNDLLFALFTVLLVAAVWRYREEADEEGEGERAPPGAGGVRGGRWLLLASAALALSFTTKETAYLTAAMVLLYLDRLGGVAARPRAPRRGGGASPAGRLLLPAAWALVALWPLAGGLRRRWGLGPWSADGDLLVVIGTLTATQIGAFALLPAGALAGELSAADERALSVAVILLLALGAAEVGLRWSRWWLAPALLFAAIYVPLYTTFGTNPAGLHSGLWGSLDYWLAQQEVQRGHQPGFYYAFMVPLYEPLALAAGLLGGCWLLVRGNRLARLLLWWFAWMFLSLSFAGEKMPWLTVHLALPLASSRRWSRGSGAPHPGSGSARRPPGPAPRRGRRPGRGPGRRARDAHRADRDAVSYLHPGTPVEPLIYTQTSPDLPEVAREIAAYAETNGTGTGLPMTVETRLSLSWPWAWYLRDYHQVLYASAETLREQEPDPGRVLIATAWTLDEVPGLRAAYGEARPYRHRSWFPEIRYKSASFGTVLSGLADGSLLHDWGRFLLVRIDESDIGSLRAEVLYPEDEAARAPGGTP